MTSPIIYQIYAKLHNSFEKRYSIVLFFHIHRQKARLSCFNMAKNEIGYAKQYDYVVENDEVAQAAQDIKTILQASAFGAVRADKIDLLLNEGVTIK